MKIQYAPQSHRVHTSIPPIGEKQRERERERERERSIICSHAKSTNKDKVPNLYLQTQFTGKDRFG